MSNGLTIDQLPSYDDTNVDTEEIVLEVEQKTISQTSERSRKMKLSEILEVIASQNINFTEEVSFQENLIIPTKEPINPQEGSLWLESEEES